MTSTGKVYPCPSPYIFFSDTTPFLLLMSPSLIFHLLLFIYFPLLSLQRLDQQMDCE
ncbi:hypothetical protein BCR42DRAFT_415933 [Absidia repens]|uniref:Uncharacterized protein n=1 Tax=Absidia repens TaxID=90262 RepID=A0A1X2IG15_9FUNG|nr:hypothetical protein BCR42DRAFT_415933 [Absidia repens]